jgi:hypothetical protein
MIDTQFKYESASRVLRKDYGANGFFWIFGSISLNAAIRVKNSMIQNNSLNDIAVLKSGIDSQVEFGKQVNLILTICTFILTTILAPLTFYLQQSVKTIDWNHELKILVAKEELAEARNETEKNKILLELINQVNKDAKDFHEGLNKLQDQQGNMLAAIVVPFLFAFILVLLRYKWLLSLSSCVGRAYEEKKEQKSKSSARREEKLNLR